MKTYDVIVIGGGTAGSNAARSASKAGAKVLMVRKKEVWNTCVQEGCMPSKSILSGAHHGEDIEKVMQTRDAHIHRLTSFLDESLQKEDFDIVNGEASFNEGETLTLKTEAGEETYKGERYVIATGSKPFVPPIEGLDTLSAERIITSEEVVSDTHITALPQSIAILGAGPIGLEMATFFREMGSEVTVIDRGATLLSRMDPEFGLMAYEYMHTVLGIQFEQVASVERVSEKDGGVVITLKDKEVVAEKLLIATGRKPHFESLNLHYLGVDVKDGRIVFDEKTLATSNPSVFVAGDVTGIHQILHYAGHMGRVAGYNAGVGDGEKETSFENMKMGIIFTNPPVAQVGLTQKEAEERGVDVVSASVSYDSIGRGILEREDVGMWKVVAEKETGKILGAQIYGSRADDLIHIMSAIMHFGGTKKDIEDMVWYHPTYAEFLQSIARKL